MKQLSIYQIRPYLRYARTVGTKDINAFNYKIKAYDNRLFYCIDGKGHFGIADKTYFVSKGALIFIPSGVEYSYHPDKFEPMVFSAFNFDFDFSFSHLSTPFPPVKSDDFDKTKILECITFLDEPIFNSPFILDKAYTVENDFIKSEEAFVKREPYFDLHCSALITSIISSILLLNKKRQQKTEKKDVLQSIIDYINKNFDKEISLKVLGETFGYHPNYLNHLFINHSGQTLYAYLQSVRIMQAIHLLQTTDKPVSDVAEEVGFCDIAHFSKTFKQKTGHSPSSFRIKG